MIVRVSGIRSTAVAMLFVIVCASGIERLLRRSTGPDNAAAIFGAPSVSPRKPVVRNAERPSDLEVHRSVARRLEEMGRGFEETLPHYRAIVDLDPADAKAHFALANHYYIAGDGERARKEFQAAARLAPDNGVYHGNLGALLFERGEYAEAVRHLRAAAEARESPASGRAQLYLARSHRHLGNSDLAATHYEEAIRRSPARFEVAEEYARFLEAKGGEDWAAEKPLRR